MPHSDAPSPGLPAILPGQVHLWWATLECSDAETSQWATLLDAQELDRARAFQFEVHRSQFLAAHGKLRTLLGWYLGQHPSNVSFSISPRGKPSVPSAGIAFNLSHSGDRMLVAISAGQELGVDLERMRSIGSSSESESLAREIMHVNELEHWLSLPPEHRQAEFFRIWTAKEAVLKSTGQGIAGGLTHFALPPTCELDLQTDGQQRAPISIQPVAVSDGFAAALATVGARPRIVLYRFPEDFPATTAQP